MATRGQTGARLVYLDNLKWVLIAGIIFTHAATAYGAVGAWFYVEPTLSPLAKTIVSLPSEAGMLFALETFMLVAGLLTVPALARKGTGKFLRDRLLRLGLPFLAAVVVVTPAVLWASVEVTGYPATLPGILQWQLQHLDPGPMWFLGVLLVFTVCYTGWRWIRPAKESAGRPLRLRHLVMGVTLMGALTFVVWFAFPLASVQPLELQLWEWPQLAVSFGLGVLAAERGWLAERPSAPIRRACWLVPLPALAVFVWLLMAFKSSQPPYVSFSGGWHWQALVLALVWGVVAVGFSLGVIDLFRQVGTWSGRLTRALGRNSYGAYFLQTPVLIALELALFRFAWPGEVKLALTAPAGIAISFGLAWAVGRAVRLRAPTFQTSRASVSQAPGTPSRLPL